VEQEALLTLFLPHKIIYFDNGLKYLWFIMKPNDYGFIYYIWIYEKIENKLKVWCNHWFYLGGRLVLVKSIDAVIHSHFMVYILIGVFANN
jgi:hypothetical protein